MMSYSVKYIIFGEDLCKLHNGRCQHRDRYYSILRYKWFRERRDTSRKMRKRRFFVLTKVGDGWSARTGIRLHGRSLNSLLHKTWAAVHTRDVIRDFPLAQALASPRPVGAALVRNETQTAFNKPNICQWPKYFSWYQFNSIHSFAASATIRAPGSARFCLARSSDVNTNVSFFLFSSLIVQLNGAQHHSQIT